MKRAAALLKALLLAGLLGLAALAAPTLTVTQNLNFGSVIPATGSNLTLDLAGVRSVAPGTFLGGSPFFGTALFRVQGTTNDAWTLTWGAGGSVPLSFTNASGKHTMTLSLSSVTVTAASGLFAKGVSSPYNLGATVTIDTAANNPPGVYQGSFPLTLNDGTAGTSTSVSVPVSVTVDPTPIQLSTDAAGLSFGAMASGAAAGGNLIVDPTGARTADPDLLLIGLGNAAHFNVQGALGAQYSVQFPPGATLTDPVSGQTMSVGAFTTNLPGLQGQLDGSGQQALQVGATLTVKPGQAPGRYTGPLTVTVVYN